MPSASSQVVRLELEPIWESTRGAGIRVAVLDTGVARSSALPEDRVRSIRADGGAPNATADTHGTSCCSLVASSGSGAEGAAPEADVLSIQIATQSRDIRAAQVVRGLERALAEGCHVISCSFTLASWAGHKGAIMDLVRRAHLAGIPVLAAAGNDVGQKSRFPEEIQHAIVVSAHDVNGAPLHVKFNQWTDIFCLGEELSVVDSDGSSQPWSGLTSGATALTAGVVALALASAPPAKRAKVGIAMEPLLKNSGTRFTLPGATGGSAWRLHAQNLVQAARAI
jgi:membrane-anchored mycosin MYCP